MARERPATPLTTDHLRRIARLLVSGPPTALEQLANEIDMEAGQARLRDERGTDDND